MTQAIDQLFEAGLRGKVGKELTPDLVLRLGAAMGFLFRQGEHRHRVLVGKDPRLSGYMLESALVSGLTSAGVEVLLTGPVPTPGVAMLTRTMRCDLGVMLTASHEPYGLNGLKIFAADGTKLSASKMGELKERVSADLLKQWAGVTELGRAQRIDGAQDRYVEHAKRTVPNECDLDGLRVVADCANGAAYKVAPQVLRELGAEVWVVGVNPDGYNINHESGFGSPELLRAKVRELRADFGIALDGDGDQVTLCAEYSHPEIFEGAFLERSFPDCAGDGLALALQVLARMKLGEVTASRICSQFA